MQTIDAVLDACVLYPMPLCDTLLSIADKGIYQPGFSQEILDEVTRNLIKKRGMSREKADFRERKIKAAFPDSLIEVPDRLVAAMTNDLKDRHVVAASVVAGAKIIVTTNLKDFQQKDLEPWGIEAQHPDTFLIQFCDEWTIEEVCDVLYEQAERQKKPPMTFKELLEKLYKDVPTFASKICGYCFGHRVIQIAGKTLDHFGIITETGVFFEGETYALERKDGKIRILDKRKNRREILTCNSHLIE